MAKEFSSTLKCYVRVQSDLYASGQVQASSKIAGRLLSGAGLRIEVFRFAKV